jgi:Rrf2 family transcriptional regulator, iron-sulfur cluster assembly transcription factor
MKISAQDEYGLRILLRIAREGGEEGLTIPQLSEAEGISEPYVGKMTRLLRMTGFIQSQKGSKGGYVLSRPAHQIKVSDVLHALGGPLFDGEFCDGHAGSFKFCTNSVDCSVRSLWKILQHAIDRVLDQVTLADLISTEENSFDMLQQTVEENLPEIRIS